MMKTALPNALTKGDYFRNRAPSNSRSPTRRPARKTQTNGEIPGLASGEPAKSRSSATKSRLPHINGSSAESDKGSDKSSNGDAMTGEVTLAFIDYRLDPSVIKKRPADQMHNVKIIQYIGQGKRTSRANHEFWMQNETAAKFPVIQQSVSSRTSLNFAFYLDGQFFHRLSVCCLNKLRTTHQIIGTKFVHFKVIDVTNIVLCFRCKGHEYMQQSFKKAGSAPLRSMSLPRHTVAAAAPLPDSTAQAKLINMNGTSPVGLKRSRSISKTRTTNTHPAVAALPRAAASTSASSSSTITHTAKSPGTSGNLRKNGPGAGKKKTGAATQQSNLSLTQQQEQQHHSAISDKEKILESYCEDRLSPISTRKIHHNGLGLVNGDGGDSRMDSPTDEKPSEFNSTSHATGKMDLSKTQRICVPLAGMGDTGSGSVDDNQMPQSPVIQRDAPDHGQSATTAAVTVHPEQMFSEKTSQPSSRKTSRSRKPSSGLRQPMMATEGARRPLSRQDSEGGESLRESSTVENGDVIGGKKNSIASQPGSGRANRSRKTSHADTGRSRGSGSEVPVLEKYQNELFGGATGDENGDLNEAAETIVRDATEGAIAENKTQIRNAEEITQEKTNESSRRGSEVPDETQQESGTEVRDAADAPWDPNCSECRKTRDIEDDDPMNRTANNKLAEDGRDPDCVECRRASEMETAAKNVGDQSFDHECWECRKAHNMDGQLSNGTPETQTMVRDSTGSANDDPECWECQKSREANELNTGTETVVRDAEEAPRMSTQPLRSNPGTPRNVDVAEDMIELAHQKPPDVVPTEMPVEAIVHNSHEHPQSEYIHRKKSDTETQVRDAPVWDPKIPDLAREDIVAFTWPGTDGKATHSHVTTPPERSKADTFSWPDANEPARKPSTSGRTRHVSVEIMDRGTILSEFADEQAKTAALDEAAAKRAAAIDRPDGGTPNSAVRNDVPLDEVELKRKKSMERAPTPKPAHRTTLGAAKSMSMNQASVDHSDNEMRRNSTPHNAEEFIEQLGYAEEPRSSSVIEDGRPGTATQEDRRRSSILSQLPVIEPLPDTHTVDHVVVAKVRRPTLEHIGHSQDSGTHISDSEKEEGKAEKKPPSTPHTAGDMISQLGFGN